MSLYNFIKYNNCISWLSFPALYDRITLSDCAINGTATEYLLANGTKALYLNGASYINGLDYILPSTFTLSVWVNQSVTPTNLGIIYDTVDTDASDSVTLKVTSANILYATVKNASYNKAVSYTISNNQWYHVVVVRTGSYLYLYVNGILVSDIADTLVLDTFTNIAIGAAANTSLYKFTGYLKNLMVFNTQLTTKQIQKLYYYTYIS